MANRKRRSSGMAGGDGPPTDDVSLAYRIHRAISYVMSLIVTVVVPTGIVMSGDSRTSYLQPAMDPPPLPSAVAVTPAGAEPPPRTPVAAPVTPRPIPTGLIISDATYKVFLLYGKFGISTCGASLIDGMPVAHHVEAFELQHATPPASPHALSIALLAYFRAMTPIPQVSFQLAGYDGNEAHSEFINVGANTIDRGNTAGNQSGAWWAGDNEIATRLAATANVAWGSLNVQDAVNFSRHLIRATIDQMRFELRFPTVGGPIDTLLINPKGSKFLLRKEHRCS